MLFNSYGFVLLFLPLTILLYYVVGKAGRTPQKMVLVLASLVFYGFFNIKYVPMLIAIVLVNFGISKWLASADKKAGKAILTAGIVFNVGILMYLKYFNFFVDSVNKVFTTALPLKELILPIGLSYITFQQIAYIVDSYRGETAGYSLLDYATFVTFFPKITQGPIVLHSQMIPQLQDKSLSKVNPDNMARGLQMFAFGMFKKVIIADTLGKAVSYGYGNFADLSSLDLIITSVAHYMQIYFDFSGYCDIANGISNMLNIELPINFNSPYRSLSVGEFWTRWQITLTNFLRKYLYFPLGGSRKGNVRTAINIFIIYIVSGIWHGANTTFIMWGLMYGICAVIMKLLGKYYEKLWKWVRWLITFLIVNITGIMFRAESVQQFGEFVKRMFTSGSFTLNLEFASQFNLKVVEAAAALLGISMTSIPILALQIVFIIGICSFICAFLKNNQIREYKFNFLSGAATFVALFWSIISFAQVSQFLYFKF